MVKVTNKEYGKLKVGDEVWYFNTWGTLCHGIISEIVNDIAVTKEGKFGGASGGAKLEVCWSSERECRQAEERRSKLQKEEYRKEIKSVEDLVKFLFTHDVSNSEVIDWEARDAAKERAKDFGIELED